MTSRFHVMPGVGQNIAWYALICNLHISAINNNKLDRALTRTVNFTKIIDELWYRDVANLQPESIKDFQVTNNANKPSIINLWFYMVLNE